MDYQGFIQTVQREAGGIGADQAERATRAALETLAERLSAGEAHDLAEQLPAEMLPWLHTTTGSQAFDLDEYLRRVAEREGMDLGTAERHARAVFFALGQAVSDDEIHDVASELPKTFEPLLAEARRQYYEILPTEEFISRVAERTGLDTDAARRATDVVLETLAERISGGEVEDLIAQLPPELHEPLRRGNEESNGVARKMTLDEFVRRLADREKVPEDQAREHARAVLAVLREAITDKEYYDVRVQLPDDYRVLLPTP
ncbi:MAG: DUF2267 domain-containing protein [Actinoallomurus sp.]